MHYMTLNNYEKCYGDWIETASVIVTNVKNTIVSIVSSLKLQL